MTTINQSGTIDGISYASSEDVDDQLGYGIVNQIVYFDQNGNQVAERQFFNFLTPGTDYGVGPKTVNADGTFTLLLSTPGGHDGIAEGYTIDTFSSAGFWTRQDVYTPIYLNPANPQAGISGYSDSYTLIDAVGAGSSGMIDGAYYDRVETVYDPGGRAVETNYLNDLNGQSTIVATQVPAAPNPVLNVPTGATAIAGAAQQLTGLSLTDSWAGVHAGTLALDISVDAGSVSGTDITTDTAFTATAGTTVHLAGTFEEINTDLGLLSFTGQAGTAHVAVQVYDQAGLSTSATETITTENGGSAATPNPILTGPTQLTTLAGTGVALNVGLNDPWAANHAGSLALDVTTDLGILTAMNGTVPVTGSGTASLHLTGNRALIGDDLSTLVLTSTQAGTAHVQIAVYDQAGIETTHLVGIAVQATAATAVA